MNAGVLVGDEAGAAGASAGDAEDELLGGGGDEVLEHLDDDRAEGRAVGGEVHEDVGAVGVLRGEAGGLLRGGRRALFELGMDAGGLEDRLREGVREGRGRARG